jgi:hypothetical protein
MVKKWSIEDRLKVDAYFSLMFAGTLIISTVGTLFVSTKLGPCTFISMLALLSTLHSGSVRRDLIQVRDELRGTDGS